MWVHVEQNLLICQSSLASSVWIERASLISPTKGCTGRCNSNPPSPPRSSCHSPMVVTPLFDHGRVCQGAIHIYLPGLAAYASGNRWQSLQLADICTDRHATRVTLHSNNYNFVREPTE